MPKNHSIEGNRFNVQHEALQARPSNQRAFWPPVHTLGSYDLFVL
jgi:hypothetical protein